MPQRTIDFLAVGPQRTGSTWLYEALLDHPGVAWPQGVKETYFFDERFDKGLRWYYRHFENADHNRMWGEVGPTYFDDLAVASRIKAHAPNCKIIITVRNPIEKSYSVFRHYHTSGLVSADFQSAIKEMPRIIDSGHYRRYCENWETTFGRDQLLLILHDDIKHFPQDCVNRVCDFLCIDQIKLEDRKHQKVNAAVSPISPRLVFVLESIAKSLRILHLHPIVNFGKRIGLKRLYHGGKPPAKLTASQQRFLQSEFEPDIKWLEQQLDRDFSSWRNNISNESKSD